MGKGFSLIETLLYLTLAATLVLVSAFYFSEIMQSRIKNQIVAEVDGQGNQLMQLMTQTIRNSVSITAPVTGANSNTLTLNVSGANPTAFDLSNGQLRISEGAGTPLVLNSSKVTVSKLNFYNFSRPSTDGIITIRFTVSYATATSRFEYNYSKDFYGTAALR